MNHIIKILGLIFFVTIALGSGPRSEGERVYDENRSAVVKKWNNIPHKKFYPPIGSSFDKVSKLSEESGHGPLTTPVQTEWENVWESETTKQLEMRRFNLVLRSNDGTVIKSDNSSIYFLRSKCSECTFGDELKLMSSNDLENKKLEKTRQIAKAEELKKRQEELKKQESKQKLELFRAQARNDIVGQALNYVSGYKEDASGYFFYFPVKKDGSNCVYEKITNFSDASVDTNVQLALAVTIGLTDTLQKGNSIIDLNKGDPNSINFSLRFGNPLFPNSNIQTKSYVTTVEGLGTFECFDCNLDRIRRAWALIYRECPGTRKAF